jgi:putative exporter of polyketide antibiotics
MAELATMVEVVSELFGMVLDTPEGMLAATFFFVTVLLAAAAAGQAAALREEEATWRIEHLLARPLGRVRWLATRTLAAIPSTTLVTAHTTGSAFTGASDGFSCTMAVSWPSSGEFYRDPAESCGGGRATYWPNTLYSGRARA